MRVLGVGIWKNKYGKGNEESYITGFALAIPV